MAQTKVTKVTKVGFWFLAKWAVGLFVLFLGVVALVSTSAIFNAILLIIAALMVIPTVWDISRDKLHFELSGFLRFVIFIILIIIGIGTYK